MIMRLWYGLLGWFSTTKLWRWLARNILGHMTFRVWGYPKFDMDGYYAIEKLLIDNPDKMFVFVGADTESLAWQFNHAITQCEWGHAGFVRLNDLKIPTLYHMRGTGLNINSLLDYLREVDSIAIMELEFGSQEDQAKAEDRFQKLLKPGVKLDYDFTLSLEDPEALADSITASEVFDLSLKIYCSEFVYIVGVGAVSNPNFTPSYFSGRWAFEPDDLFHSTKVVYQA